MDVHSTHFCTALSGFRTIFSFKHFGAKVFIDVVIYVELFAARCCQNIRFCRQVRTISVCVLANKNVQKTICLNKV